jgi:protein-S-isoprenylcysteine O-methyltransferase Ste14
MNPCSIIQFVKKLFRWSGALVFLLSLLSFLVMYQIRLRVPAADDLGATRDAIANVILFTIFALHHSIMARTGAKAWLTRMVPADLERSVYVWIASVLFLAVCWMWQPLPGMIWQVRGTGVMVVLYLAQAFGIAITLRAAQIVGIWELAGVTQPDLTKPIEFRAAGPFSLVRHPIYLGWVLMVFATPEMTTSRLLFAGISTLYLIAAIPFEERSLLEHFPDKYGAYQKQMRWRLIPFVW